MTSPPFHLAFPVDNLDKAKDFYKDIMGCSIGRSSEQWIDFNFYGHQIVAHLSSNDNNVITNAVDGDDVPVPHFGVILGWDAWHKLSDRLKKHNIDFLIEPHIRFEGKVGEQATMFFQDPSGNALEIKAFKDMTQLFATAS